jgi:hypothetical protein
MDIVRITMKGYGCEVNRGVVPNGIEKKIEKTLDNVWYKNIFEKIGQKTKIKSVVNEVGLLNGEVKVEVNGETIIETPIRSFEALTSSYENKVKYPKEGGIIVTSIQHQEGVFLDTIFILDGVFDIEKLVISKKDILDKVDNIIIPSLYCEMYYDGYLIPTEKGITDLRMSKLFFEKTKLNE